MIPEKDMRLKVGDYIEREIEKGGLAPAGPSGDGTRNGEEEGKAGISGPSKLEDKVRFSALLY